MPAEVNETSIIEAILFVGGSPVTIEHLTKVLRGAQADSIAESVARLSNLYHLQNRPYEIVHLPEGYLLRLRDEYSTLLQRIRSQNRTVRLSKAAVEVLSIIAYRQPVSVQEVDNLRGADCGSIVRLLKRRNLVQLTESRNAKTPQYTTTKRFLQMFHLRSLEDLPRFEL